MQDILDMSLSDFINTKNYLCESNRRDSGKSIFRKLTDSQKKLLNNKRQRKINGRRSKN